MPIETVSAQPAGRACGLRGPHAGELKGSHEPRPASGGNVRGAGGHAGGRFDVIDFLQILTGRFVELLEVAAAGIVLADQRGRCGR